MTKLLNEAFARLAELDEEQQEAFARWVLNELKQKKGWAMHAGAESGDLVELADEALDEHHRGETEPLDPDAL